MAKLLELVSFVIHALFILRIVLTAGSCNTPPRADPQPRVTSRPHHAHANAREASPPA